jgi:SAM-dependent methyltransferase
MTHAFHSPMVEAALGELGAAAAQLEHREPRLLFVSNVTGRPAGPDEVDARYWARHARQPVRFAQGLAALSAEGIDVFVELGPHAALLPLGPQCVTEESTWVPTLRRGEDDWARILETVGSLYVRGADIDWAAMHRGLSRRTVTLPTYPFQRGRHWVETAAARRRDRSATPAVVRDAVTVAGRRQMDQAPLDLALASYPAKWRALNRLATGYVAAAFAELGCFATAGARHRLDDLAERWALPPVRRHLLGRWLDRLATDGLLRAHDGQLQAEVPLSGGLVENAHAEAREALADTPGLLDYVDRCGTRLAAVLTGRESALETLFPGGGFETTDLLYERWAAARYMNGIVRAVIDGWVRVQPPELRVRVLEVGAGTGGTTAAILPTLPEHRTEYVYTDVSTFFLDHARLKFAGFPFVRTGLLDLERDPREQGHEPASFHLVVAANVLHATQDLGRTLEHLRGLLAPGGMLVAYEATTHHPWFDMTTGLIEGWLRFADAWRRDHPLLPPERWDAALRTHGYDHVLVLPEAGSPAEVLGQHVIAAFVPGVATTVGGDSTGGESEHDESMALPDAPDTAAAELRRRLSEAPEGEQHETLIGYVREVVARVLHVEAPEELDRRSRLMDLGIDSLMALELRKRLGTGLGLTRALPATLIFDHPSIEAIARLLGQQLVPGHDANGHRAVAPPPVELPEPERRLAPEAVQALDDADVEALLLKKLETLR